MTEEDNPPVVTAHVAAVSMKIPPFWPADPQIWFAQVEAQFSTRGIASQKTKFDHVVASLSPEFATEVRDLILKPPEATPYDILKQQLIKRTTASEQRRLQQLLSTKELGDRKPTQLLRQMQQLLGDAPEIADGSFIRELFLQRLPGNVRMVLASAGPDVTLEGLAQLADKVAEVATPLISAVHNSSHLVTEMEQLRSEVAGLKKLVRNLTRPRSPPPSPSHQPSSSDLCWYHQCYGDAARKCKPPCSKSGNDSASH